MLPFLEGVKSNSSERWRGERALGTPAPPPSSLGAWHPGCAVAELRLMRAGGSGAAGLGCPPPTPAVTSRPRVVLRWRCQAALPRSADPRSPSLRFSCSYLRSRHIAAPSTSAVSPGEGAAPCWGAGCGGGSGEAGGGASCRAPSRNRGRGILQGCWNQPRRGQPEPRRAPTGRGVTVPNHPPPARTRGAAGPWAPQCSPVWARSELPSGKSPRCPRASARRGRWRPRQRAGGGNGGFWCHRVVSALCAPQKPELLTLPLATRILPSERDAAGCGGSGIVARSLP